MASQVVLISALLFFYIVRSSLLFLLFHHISRTTYATFYSDLSLLDIILQIALAVELSLAILRCGSKSLLPRGLLIPLLFLARCGFYRSSRCGSPSPFSGSGRPRDPFTGFLFLLLFAWSFSVTSYSVETIGPHWPCCHRWKRHLVAIRKVSVAALHHNAHLFSLWSYGNAGAYLIVLLFWVLRCGSVTTKPTLSVQSARRQRTALREAVPERQA